MSELLKLRPLAGQCALDVEVCDSSDASYIDLIVSNKRGQIGSVTLKLDGAGNLVLHAERWTRREDAPEDQNPESVIEETVLVAAALEAVPLGGE